MRVLVTGATGFLGANLVSKLQTQNLRVGCLLRSDSSSAYLNSLAKRNLNEPVTLKMTASYDNLDELVHQFSPTITVHIAAHPGGSRDTETIKKQVDSNILFPSLLLQHCLENDCKSLIYIGTSWQSIYGRGYKPFDFYSATKQSFENIVDDYVLEGFRAINLRMFDLFGPNDPRKKLMTLLENIALTGESLDMSPGEQKIDLVHVDDAVAAIQIAMKRLKNNAYGTHERFCVSGGRPQSLKDIVRNFEVKNRVALNIKWGARNYRDREVMMPTSEFPNILDL